MGTHSIPASRPARKPRTAGDALFFISADEWAKVPRVSHPPRTDEAILIDGRHATITVVQENAGLYDITISYAGTGRSYAN